MVREREEVGGGESRKGEREGGRKIVRAERLFTIKVPIIMGLNYTAHVASML